MKIFNLSYVRRIVIILFMVVGLNSETTGTQYNIISSSNKSVQLKRWKITEDFAPDKILRKSDNYIWLPVNSSLALDKYSEGNWLIRTEIIIEDSVNEKTVLGLFPLSFITAYEIYWDEIKLGQNGAIGVNNTGERTGLFNYNLPLSPNLVTVGKHTITLRISNHQNYSSWRWYYGGVIVGKYDEVLMNIYQSNYTAFFIIGILFIPFLFNLFLYFTRKRKTEHLLFSLICLLVIIDSATYIAPDYINAPTTVIFWQYYIYHIITVLFSILFPTFFINMFSFSKKFVGLIVIINLIVYIFLTTQLSSFNIMSLMVLSESSVISLWALFTKREESINIFIGLVVAWVVLYFNFAFNGLATVMVICTSFSIAKQFARTERAEKEAQLKSVHLENELLKKNINPHFILNTLTSIIVWLRKDPKSAIKLIEALADEFRLITQISALKQIPIQQEIDLCKTHLKIMSYRKGVEYKIETEDLLDEENVPPMIFHTLIENGLTHGYENKGNGTFKLQRNKNQEGIKYILSNDGEFDNDGRKRSSGFGLRYVKSRLEESYQDRWRLTSHKTEQGWETIIEIKDK